MSVTSHGGCRKFLLLFGRIGPLALRPCALLRAWGFLPRSINILQIPLWYGDMMWYGVSCARPCALLRGPAFLMPLYHALKILSPTKMWLKGRGFFINPHMTSHYIKWHDMTPAHPHETSGTVRGATRGIVQYLELSKLWKAKKQWSYNIHVWSLSHMKRAVQCAGATGVTPQHHQNLRLLRKSNSSFDPKIRDLFPPKEERFEHDPRTIRALSEDNRTINFSSGPRPFAELTSPILAKEKSIWRSCYLPKFHQVLRLPRKLTFQPTSPNIAPATKSYIPTSLQLHQILRLPWKVNTATLHQLLRLHAP